MANYIPLVFDKDTGRMVAKGGAALTGGARGWQHIQDSAATTWTITHGQNSEQLTVQVFDDTNVAEVTEITFNDDGATISHGDYWLLNTPLTEYFVWYNKDNSGAPDVSNKTGIEVALDGSETTDQVAEATQAVLDAESAFSVTVSGSVITVTNNERGAVTDASDYNTNVGINVVTDGETNPKSVIVPDAIEIINRNTVELTFSSAQAGQAHITFFTDVRDV